MDSSSDSQLLLKKIYEFNRLTMSNSYEDIKTAIQEMLHLWPEVLAAGDKATDDELFTLNVSRAILTQVFTIVLSKDLFHKDHLLIREIFFACFNILVNHANIFQNNNSTFIDSNVRLLMKMVTSISSSVHFQHGDLSEIADQKLLIAMREHIDQDSKHDNLTDGIISLIWNLSDRTILVPVLLDTGYANSVVQWIKDRKMKFRDDKLDAPIHILHNLSRHDDGIDQLNTYDALKVIEEIQIESVACDDANDMRIHIAMIRALLTDVNQIKIDGTNYPNQIVNMLVQLSTKAAKNERYRCNGSHVSEPLTVLVKLFYNDEILDNILSNNAPESSVNSQSIIELFTSLLIKFYPKINLDNDLLEKYTCVVIFNLFWLISNHKKYCQLIGNHTQLMEIMTNAANDEQDFKDTFMPRTMKSIQQTAGYILKNLNVHH
jgi:hypothetical protein